MIPSTLMAIGFARQRNIGLDKENFTGAFTTPKKITPLVLTLNAQFVQNLNRKIILMSTDLPILLERN
jgi:hypothetical protein